MSKQRASHLVEAAIWLEASGDVDGARKLYRQALKIDPGSARARKALERLEAKLGGHTPQPPSPSQGRSLPPWSPPPPSPPPPPAAPVPDGDTLVQFPSPMPEAALPVDADRGLEPPTLVEMPPAQASGRLGDGQNAPTLPGVPIPEGSPGALAEPLQAEPRTDPAALAASPRPELSTDWGSKVAPAPPRSGQPMVPPGLRPREDRAPPPALLQWEPIPQQGEAPPRNAWESDGSPAVVLTALTPQQPMKARLARDVFDVLSEAPPRATPPPFAHPESIRQEVEVLIKGARDLQELDDHSGAMDLLQKAAVLAPDDPTVLRLKEKSEVVLQSMYESKLGRLDARPRLSLRPDEIIWLKLDHRAGFVLAQIDGSVTYEDLFAICGMSRVDTLRILAQLVGAGVITSLSS